MNKNICLEDNGMVALSKEEAKMVDGGIFWATIILIGAGVAAASAIFEAGKTTGDFIYHITH